MPSGAISSAVQLLERGANPRYRAAYDRNYQAALGRLGKIMELNVPSQKSIELLPYMLAMPHARAWPEGGAIPEGASTSRSFTVVNRPWGLRLPVRESDAQTFDQVNYLLTSVSQGGKSAAWVPERVAFQFMLNTVDLDLIPAVPNAADGAAMYSTTDGSGANRFGVLNGNLPTKSGVGSATAIITDLTGAIGQGRQFQDGQGQPLWSEDIFDSEILIIAPAKDELVFQQAFAQKYVFQQNAGGNAAAAPSNLILDASYKVSLWLTARITNDKWFVWLTGAPAKALVNTLASPIRYLFKTPENSDWCSTFRTILMQWDWIAGFGIGEVYQTLKIDN